MEIEYGFTDPSCAASPGPQKLAIIRNFNLDHYNVTFTTCTELVNDQYEKQGEYRFGFNGMEKDDEVKGSGNSYDFGARIYDPSLGRWLSLDPLMKLYPFVSDYSFALNNPIYFIDPSGEKIVVPTLQGQAKVLEAMTKAFGANGASFSFNANNELQFTGNPSSFSAAEKEVFTPLFSLMTKTEVFEYAYSKTVQTDLNNGELTVPSFDQNGKVDGGFSRIDPSEDHAIYGEGEMDVYLDEYGRKTDDPTKSANKDSFGQGVPYATVPVDGARLTSNSTAARFFHSIGHFLYDTPNGSSRKVNDYENKARRIFKDFNPKKNKYKDNSETPLRNPVDDTHP